MFGLEGCGFVLSISITFLLIGLVVYLFKSQLKTLEQKFVAIFQLSQTLATSVETLRHNCTTGGNNNPSHPPTTKDIRPDVILSDSETESDTESEDDNGNVYCPFPNVKIVDIEKEPLKEHMLNVFNFNNSEMNNILDVTDILSDKGGADKGGADKGGADNSEDDTDDSDSEDAEDDVVVEDAEDDEAEEEEGEEDAEPGSPNYKGMKVPDLRKLVHTKNITTDQTLKSLKKNELIELLKKNN